MTYDISLYKIYRLNTIDMYALPISFRYEDFNHASNLFNEYYLFNSINVSRLTMEDHEIRFGNLIHLNNDKEEEARKLLISTLFKKYMDKL